MVSFIVSINAMSSGCNGIYMFIMICGASDAFLISIICRYGEIVFGVKILWMLPGNDKVL